MIDPSKKSPLKQLSGLRIASLILAVAMMLCLLHMPYGYYTIVRLATAIVASCWAVCFLNESKKELTIVSFGVAILFQPFLKISLDKGTWNVLDIIIAVALVLLSLKQNKK